MPLMAEKNFNRCAKRLHFPKVFLGTEQSKKLGFLLLCVLRLNFPPRFASVSPCYFSRLFNCLATVRSVGAAHLNAMRKWTLSSLETSSIFRSDWGILFSLKYSFPFFSLYYLVHLLTLELKIERWKFTLSETAGKTYFNFSSCGGPLKGFTSSAQKWIRRLAGLCYCPPVQPRVLERQCQCLWQVVNEKLRFALHSGKLSLHLQLTDVRDSARSRNERTYLSTCSYFTSLEKRLRADIFFHTIFIDHIWISYRQYFSDNETIFSTLNHHHRSKRVELAQNCN